MFVVCHLRLICTQIDRCSRHQKADQRLLLKRQPDKCSFCSLFEVLGHGKDSTIYKGRKKQTICYYAIKRVPKDAKARVLQEVRSHALGDLCCSLAFSTLQTFHGACGNSPEVPSVQVRAMTALHHDNVLRFHSWYVALLINVLKQSQLAPEHCTQTLFIKLLILLEALRLCMFALRNVPGAKGRARRLSTYTGVRPGTICGWCWSTVWEAISIHC